MTDGLFKKLSPEQQAAALAFDGNPDFGPPMTDLTQAIALMRRVCAAEGPWEAEDFVRSDDLAKGLQPGPVDKAEATILNAAASGELIPLADHKLAVALVVEKAAQSGYVACAETRHVSLGNKVRDTIRALADTDALAEVQALRERVRSLSWMGEGYVFVERRAEAAEAELAATQAKLARLATYEAFTTDGWGFSHPEITARVQYARAALEGAKP